jgi:hypothetical protein
MNSLGALLPRDERHCRGKHLRFRHRPVECTSPRLYAAHASDLGGMPRLHGVDPERSGQKVAATCQPRRLALVSGDACLFQRLRHQRKSPEVLEDVGISSPSREVEARLADCRRAQRAGQGRYMLRFMPADGAEDPAELSRHDSGVQRGSVKFILKIFEGEREIEDVDNLPRQALREGLGRRGGEHDRNCRQSAELGTDFQEQILEPIRSARSGSSVSRIVFEAMEMVLEWRGSGQPGRCDRRCDERRSGHQHLRRRT